MRALQATATNLDNLEAAAAVPHDRLVQAGFLLDLYFVTVVLVVLKLPGLSATCRAVAQVG